MKFARLIFCCLAVLALLPESALAQKSSGRFVPNEVLVKFRPEASKARRNKVLAGRSGRVLRHFETLDIDHVALPDGTDVQSAVQNFLARGEVLLAQPNYIRHVDADAPPNEPAWLENQLWGLLKIQAQPAWLQFGGGNGSVVLADIDTGVNYNHPDLAPNIWQNPGEIPGNGIDDDDNGYIDDVHGIDTVNHDSDPMDDYGHGTHTSGTMAAAGNNGAGVTGVSWNAKIIVCKFLDQNGSGEDSGAIECLNYLIALKRRGVNIRATNCSWGGKLAPEDEFPSALKAAFEAAGAENILSVCSAGNDGTDNDAVPNYPASFDSACIVAVAASDQGDNRAWFSEYGATSVDLAAPGVDIFSTVPAGYGNLSGTSMSTPHVTGAVALLAQINPGASAATIKSLLLNNVDVLPQWSGLTVSGGRLNLFRAAQAAAAGLEPFSISAANHPAADELELTWSPVPGMRYQVFSSDSLTTVFTSLSDVIVAGQGENALTFTDLAASGPQKFYQVRIVP